MSIWTIAAMLAAAHPTQAPLDVPQDYAVAPRLLQKSSGDSLPSRDEFRAAYTHVMRLTGGAKRPSPESVVPELVRLYRALERVEGISHAERRRLRRGLLTRMEEQLGRLLRSVHDRQLVEDWRRYREANGESFRELSGGNAQQTRAMELIALIQSTIAPDTWAINGGKGTISYFPLLYALVVRQTSEVHHQLGGGLHVLRQAR